MERHFQDLTEEIERIIDSTDYALEVWPWVDKFWPDKTKPLKTITINLKVSQQTAATSQDQPTAASEATASNPTVSKDQPTTASEATASQDQTTPAPLATASDPTASQRNLLSMDSYSSSSLMNVNTYSAIVVTLFFVLFSIMASYYYLQR